MKTILKIILFIWLIACGIYVFTSIMYMGGVFGMMVHPTLSEIGPYVAVTAALACGKLAFSLKILGK